jgi:hypothetical protein
VIQPISHLSPATSKSGKIKDEEGLDRDISQLLEPLTPTPSSPSTVNSPGDDSILGSDLSEEEEEDEVNELLAED